MYKNQLQELAQRSCFNLPSYSCTREGPDHAPRFKASVNFNGEVFESRSYCTTVRQAEHSAAEVALNVLSSRGPATSLTAKLLEESGIYKNLLQESAHRGGLKLPVYTTVRSGPGHAPVFTCTVELAGVKFNGEAAKTKKQAEKNAAIAAWSALNTTIPLRNSQQQEQAVVWPSSKGRSRRRRRSHSNSTSLQQKWSWRLWDLFSPPNRPMEEQLRDEVVVEEEEWLGGKSEKDCSSSTYYRPFPLLSSHSASGIGIGNQLVGASSMGSNMMMRNRVVGSPIAPPVKLKLNPSMHYTPQERMRIAPAVQIRTVIPVCAAPPPSTTTTSSSNPSPTLKLKDISASPPNLTVPDSATSMSFTTIKNGGGGGAEVSVSKLSSNNNNRPHLQKQESEAELRCSDFNSKLQL